MERGFAAQEGGRCCRCMLLLISTVIIPATEGVAVGKHQILNTHDRGAGTVAGLLRGAEGTTTVASVASAAEVDAAAQSTSQAPWTVASGPLHPRSRSRDPETQLHSHSLQLAAQSRPLSRLRPCHDSHTGKPRLCLYRGSHHGHLHARPTEGHFAVAVAVAAQLQLPVSTAAYALAVVDARHRSCPSAGLAVAVVLLLQRHPYLCSTV